MGRHELCSRYSVTKTERSLGLAARPMGRPEYKVLNWKGLQLLRAGTFTFKRTLEFASEEDAKTFLEAHESGDEELIEAAPQWISRTWTGNRTEKVSSRARKPIPLGDNYTHVSTQQCPNDVWVSLGIEDGIASGLYFTQDHDEEQEILVGFELIDDDEGKPGLGRGRVDPGTKTVIHSGTCMAYSRLAPITKAGPVQGSSASPFIINDCEFSACHDIQLTVLFRKAYRSVACDREGRASLPGMIEDRILRKAFQWGQAR